jgi:hypothetical protein
MKSNFMTQSTEKESVALEEVREGVTGKIKPCLYRLCGIVRQRDINNLEKKWVTVEDMMAGGDYAQIQGTASVWAKLASAWHVGTCLGQYAMSYLYFTLSPTGASALAARNGRLRHFREQLAMSVLWCRRHALWEPSLWKLNNVKKSVTNLCGSR